VNAKIALSLSLEPGHVFPKVSFKDTSLKATELKQKIAAKYTLLDFWFSNCFPCIEQFAKLKQIYSSSTRGQLQIILVSIDRTQDIINWKKTIAKHELPFLNLLDENGTLTTSTLNVTKFPSNFLLDSSGKIIARDITLEKLNQLLTAY
jgi:peroxiredoxin